MSSRNDRQRSVNERIRHAAAAQGLDANRLRRSLVFHRVLARLAPRGLVLKGGFSLEVRLPGSARATKDVDLVGQIAMTADPEQLVDALDELLAINADHDGFTFRISHPARLRDEGADAHAWRVTVTSALDGAEFERVKLDVVGQVDEVVGGTEMLTVPPPVAVPGLTAVVVEAVDVYQHAAEKLHAYARIYAHDRPSSRVKDLVDLVLLIEAALLVDRRRLWERLQVVYERRDGTRPARELPQPPGDWAIPYARLAAELDLVAATAETAYRTVADRYAAALTEGTTT